MTIWLAHTGGQLAINVQLSAKIGKQQQSARVAFMDILSSIRLLAWQGLALLGHYSKFSSMPRQQKFRAMNGAHLASPIRGELRYAHWPQLGSQIHCPIGNQIWGPFMTL